MPELHLPEFPVLETERLVLRVPREGDLDGFAALMADEESARHIGGVQARSAAWRGMATMSGAWLLKGFSMFSVVEKASGAWVGRIGPWFPEDWPGTEVGWGLLREHWGKGYGAEAATASIDWAFTALGWTEVIHTIASENANSKAWPPASARATCARVACRRRGTWNWRSGDSRGKSGSPVGGSRTSPLRAGRPRSCG